ncbi:MAG: hypothetical protein V4667_07320 [Bacteroidota bacterium]
MKRVLTALIILLVATFVANAQTELNSTGTGSAYAISYPAAFSYSSGITITFKAHTVNLGAATLNINGLGAKTIFKNVSTNLAVGDILANQFVTVIYDGTNFQLTSTLPSGASGWSLGGNTGTNPATDFIGTTDVTTLVFKVNNTQSGLISISNTGFGYETISPAATGGNNSAFGYYALPFNTSGASNSAFGSAALNSNADGSMNSAFGVAALQTNTSGADNSAFGAWALSSNKAGQNSAFGSGALQNNSTGDYNTAIGYSAMQNNNTESYNVALGTWALRGNLTNGQNTAIGHSALQDNTGGYNTAMGYISLLANTTGTQNTAIGSLAGLANTTGSNNTFLGYYANAGSAALDNATAIGANAVVTTSNSIQLGNTSVNQVNVGVGNTAKLITGALQITGGTLAAGKILTSDAAGNATWQTPGGGTNWQLNGNAVTTHTSIGTTSAYDLPFITNGAERMRLMSTGGLAIGANNTYGSILNVTGNEVVFENNPTGIYYTSASTIGSGYAQQVYDASSGATGAPTMKYIFSPRNNPNTGTSPFGEISFGKIANQNYGYIAFSTRNAANSYAERIRIDAEGNMGIGLGVDPITSKLHVYDNSTTRGGAWQAQKVYGFGTSSTTNGIGLEAKAGVYDGGGTGGTFTGVKGIAEWGTTNYGVYGVGSTATSVSHGVYGEAITTGNPTNIGVYGIATNGTNNWAGYFDGRAYFAGNVGVGINNPTAKLHIGGTSGVDGIRFPDGTLQTTAAVAGSWTKTGSTISPTVTSDNVEIASTSNYPLIVGSSSSESIFDFKNTSAGGKSWWFVTGGAGGALSGGKFGIFDPSASTTRLAIDAAGNVGINTTAPSEKLDVVGNIEIPAANDYKYATAKNLLYSIPASEFMPTNTFYTKVSEATHYEVYCSNGTYPNLVEFSAPIHVPDGAQLNTILVSVYDLDATYVVSGDLIVYDANTDAIANYPMGNSGATPGNTSISVNAGVAVDNLNKNYFLRIYLRQATANLRIRGARVSYSVTKAD